MDRKKLKFILCFIMITFVVTIAGVMRSITTTDPRLDLIFSTLPWLCVVSTWMICMNVIVNDF